MISVAALTRRLSGDRKAISAVLTGLGYREEELRYSPHGYFQFRRPDGDNPKAIQLWVDSLNYTCYTRPDKGNLYTLVMRNRNLTFPKALRWVAETLGFTDVEIREVSFPFGGFYHGLRGGQADDELPLKTYDEAILKPFQENLSYMWFRDGISYKTQETFGIGMDLDANAILIPERSVTGELIGIQARRNDSHCPHNERWWAYLPCQRSRTLFGFAMHYEKIVESGTVFIVEAEKSVMKGYEMGVHNVVALCGATISKAQVALFKSLRLQNYILCLDDGLPPEHYRAEAQKLLSQSPLFTPNIFYIHDQNHTYLKEGEKESPFDKPLPVLKALVKNCKVPVKDTKNDE